ncbi:RNA polymerase sigma-70 factor [Mucilaginibacter rubeus]|uniref:RNA polymerase sigma-70 factor n=1 Tax=Mucilaginibacter rubeus TaxID=2027860 RepID=A0AAE6JJV3_9SPHI|nr:MULTISPECIES: RNA polymerase sigma-70 factor [Mucilaginibacter]QEM06758.1 RNA polymerase sigma-70 factor [Mucilaginibacter rubeus]QEM19346.1 RNA polymerase sigma-70 factor [Mucilaginibacter gossypii]QTE44106.1 RNA polymerase sigma-70 factor [Mucilaginibacter rubeus]QTE50707.1 RNA polymerase sigma-70 factor [Mucilaginibacter rubeus]QTE55789.1 RNA polymerase sigma-70 factor [Mucilaginibacter rubeus]
MNLTAKQAIFSANIYTLKVEYSDSTAIGLIKQGSQKAFERLFKDNFKSLHTYAYTFLKDDEMAEEVVQNVFCRIWEKRDQLKTDGSIKAYLYRSVHNESLNYLKHQKVRANFGVYYADEMDQVGNDDSASKKLLTAELQKHIEKALSELPEQCRIIFQLSRFEQLKYQQIADQMGLSIKTIENQMGKALRVMRQKLAEFLPIILLLFINWFV